MSIDFSQLITQEEKQDAARNTVVAALANLRWEREVGGILLNNGATLNTSRESQAQVFGLVSSIENGLRKLPILWKFGTRWESLDSVEIKEIGEKMAAHIGRCFQAEQTVSGQIENRTSFEGFDLMDRFEQAYHSAD